MLIVKQILAVFFAFAGGMFISGGVFAFIAIIGVVPRLAQKTGTDQFAKLYEEAIIFGGFFGALAFFIPTGFFPRDGAVAVYNFCGGIFFGVLAMSLAEVLDVMPILSRRIKIQNGMFFFVLSIALGKFLGSILYFFVPGFYVPH